MWPVARADYGFGSPTNIMNEPLGANARVKSRHERSTVVIREYFGECIELLAFARP